MAGTLALTKILHIREKEKNDAQKAYKKSIDFFEAVATQLYSVLKKKEAAEASYHAYLSGTSQLDKIKEQAAYIEALNKKIIQLQASVQKARSAMETKQAALKNAHTEVKKFEKIIEHRQLAFRTALEKEEMAMMDEISISQFASRENR